MIIKSLATRIKEGVPYTVGFVLANLTLPPTYLQFHIGHVVEESSSAGESHPHALPEPDVNLSIHPALIAQPSVASPFANGQIDWVPSLQCALTNRPPSVRGA